MHGSQRRWQHERGSGGWGGSGIGGVTMDGLAARRRRHQVACSHPARVSCDFGFPASPAPARGMADFVTDFLFVYGTLRPAARHSNAEARRAAEVLIAKGQRIGCARAPGRLYKVSWYPGAIEKVQPGEFVRGDLFRVPRPLLCVLDRYEGASVRRSAQREYVRVKRAVTLRNGLRVRAWMYLYNRPLRGNLIRGGDFLRRPGSMTDR